MTSRSARRCSIRAIPSISSSTIPRPCSQRSPTIYERHKQVSSAARPCLDRIPAATTTTSPSPCRPMPAPPTANARCRPPRSGSEKSLRSGRRNDEQRVQSAERRRCALPCDQPSCSLHPGRGRRGLSSTAISWEARFVPLPSAASMVTRQPSNPAKF